MIDDDTPDLVGGRLTITKEIEFDAGHRVPTHGGKCRSPHGHRYKVRVTCSGDLVDDGGVETAMLADFGFLKELLTLHVHDVLDHGMIVWESDVPLLAAMEFGNDADVDQELDWRVIVFPVIPTAENMARWVAWKLDYLVAARSESLRLEEVTVWETPTSTATWSRSPSEPPSS